MKVVGEGFKWYTLNILKEEGNLMSGKTNNKSQITIFK